jgi:hypothetical protein
MESLKEGTKRFEKARGEQKKKRKSSGKVTEDS